MKNKPCSLNRARKDNQEELEYLVLKGNCPYCNCNRVKYREYIAHQRFGFKCTECKWEGKYKLKDFNKFAQNYHYISS